MVRRGRLANSEREIILNAIGEEAERRYQENLVQTGYKGLYKFMDAFNFEPDIQAFDNNYWLDTGDTETTRILTYLEYGTGLYGPNQKPIQSSKISEKTGVNTLLKFKYRGVQLYKMTVKGIKPGFMFTKAIESVRNERNMLMRNVRLEEEI